MKVKVCNNFFDEQEKVDRKTGEVFECSEERYNEIKAKLPQWVEVAEEKKTAPKKTARKAATRK